jgi:MFS transporter, DHA1 family, multidrug resistance protein
MLSPQGHQHQAFKMSEREFVGLMAACQALQALAIDSMLPALARIGRDLGVADPNSAQLLVGVFLVCSGIGALFPGAIADRFGRKPVLLVCLSGYVLLTLVCAIARDFTLLLITRGALGIITSGMMVMPMAILRDRYSGDQMARTQSLISMVFMVVPMIAPMMGQGVMLLAGWRWIFGVMAVLAALVFVWVMVRLPETLHPDYSQPIRPLIIVRNMGTALTDRKAAGYIYGLALVQSGLFGYVSCSEQLLGQHFGAGLWFPVIFGGMAMVMAGTNFVNASIVEKFGARRVSQTALLGGIAAAALHVWFALNGETLWIFILLMTVSMCTMSFIGANFASIAMQPFPEIAGSASSGMSFVRVALGSALGAAIGQAYDGTPVPLIASILVCAVLTLLLVLWSEDGRLFRRLNFPPGKGPAGGV